MYSEANRIDITHEFNQQTTAHFDDRILAMTVAKIHGAEFPVRKIFSNDFNFKIPLYQRPYSKRIRRYLNSKADPIWFTKIG